MTLDNITVEYIFIRVGWDNKNRANQCGGGKSVDYLTLPLLSRSYKFILS